MQGVHKGSSALATTRRMSRPTTDARPILPREFFAFLQGGRMSAVPLSLTQRLLFSYLQQLNDHPLFTKCVTASVLNATEEALVQSATYENGINYRTFKVLKMAAYGFFVGAPVSHFSYALLNRLVTGETLVAQLIKLAVSNGCVRCRAEAGPRQGAFCSRSTPLKRDSASA